MEIYSADYHAFYQKMNQLTDHFAQLSELVAELSENTACLDIFWDGDANSAFVAAVGEDLVMADGLLIRIRDSIRLLRRVFGIYMDNEKEVKRMMEDNIR